MRDGDLRHGRVLGIGLLLGMALCACTTAPLPGPGTASLETEVPEGLEVVERPELEPMWAYFVKYYYPNWREHYWVDRGEWGNKGYVLGRAPETRRTGEMPRVQLTEQAPYGLDLQTASAPPRPLGMTPLEDLGAPAGPGAGRRPTEGSSSGGPIRLDLPPLETGREMPVERRVVRPAGTPVAPRTAPRAAPRAAPRRTASEYVVQKGDSLWSIASKVYGDPLGWVDIYRANQDVLPDPQRIFPNQRLAIPPR